MQFKHIGGPVRTQSVAAAPVGDTRFRRSPARYFAGLVLAIALAALLGACSSGSGGDNGRPSGMGANKNVSGQPFPQVDSQPNGLDFTFPFNGQQDVVLTTQIVVNFNFPINSGDVDGPIDQALELRAGTNSDAPTDPIDIVLDDNQIDILRIQQRQALRPLTTYQVVATTRIGDGTTVFRPGDVLFQFTTRPQEGRPARGGFKVVQTTPGDTNPVTKVTLPFADFDTLGVRFSEPVDATTVTKGGSFKFTGPNGDEVPGRLQVLGRNLTFDPSDRRLQPGQYTVRISDNVTSVFGNSLKAFSTTKQVQSAGKPDDPNDVGDPATENQVVQPTTDNAAQTVADMNLLPDNRINGITSNLTTIFSPLVGLNQLLAFNAPTRRGVQATLAAPGLFGTIEPAVIRAGQKTELTSVAISFNGDVPSQVVTGPANIPFANDTNVYIMANSLRNIVKPAAVQIRTDLDIGSLVDDVQGQNAKYLRQAQANGLLNQTVLNIQVAGLAIPITDKNANGVGKSGDLAISAVGTFIINVNRNTNATVQLALTFVLPLDGPTDLNNFDNGSPFDIAEQQPQVQPDTKAPFAIGQYPSSCFYLYGTQGYNDLSGGGSPVAPPARSENTCKNQNGTNINSFPLEASPSVAFSEPIDPITVGQRSVQLTGPNGNVPSRITADGSSIIIDPQQTLQPNTQYTINLSSGQQLTDLAGNTFIKGEQDPNASPNPVNFNNPAISAKQIKFTTEPMVPSRNNPQPSPPLLSTLTPGIACALAGGDFQNGGDQAGNCIGDANNGSFPDLPVFRRPANKTIDFYFTEFVQQDSVVLANGCLVNGSGNSRGNATVAIQRMNGNGQCEGVVAGQIAFADRDTDVTRGFTFRPEGHLNPGTRYWIVVCGTLGFNGGSSSCANTIVDTDGTALDTDPITGTGSTDQPDNGNDTPQGGPDIVMPFDATPQSVEYYTNAFTLPKSDTNGDGQFNNGENRQPGNRSLVTVTSNGVQIQNDARNDGRFPSYTSGTRPVVFRKNTLNDCGFLAGITNDDGDPAVGDIPDQCIPASLLNGGFNFLTSINIGAQELLNSLTVAFTQPTQSLQDVLNGLMSSGTGGSGSGTSGGSGGGGSTVTPSTPIGSLPSGVQDAIGGLAGALTGGGGGTGGGSSGTGSGGTAPAPDPSALRDAVQGTPLAPIVDTLLDPTTSVSDLQALLSDPANLATQFLNTLLAQAGIPLNAAAPVQTGRVILRFPDGEDAVGDRTRTQAGYIVKECSGTINGRAYDFKPCFIAQLKLVANAPDSQGVELQQQRTTANVVGAVTFEQNGRLVIDNVNVNRITLSATAFGALPTTATIRPGGLTLQLAGNTVHGGRAFPNR